MQPQIRILLLQVIAKFTERVRSVEGDIAKVLREEKIDRDMQDMEKSLNKAERKLNKTTQPDSKSTESGLQRNWFQTPKERNEEKKQLRLGKHTKLDGKAGVNIPNARATAESRVEWELQKAAAYQVNNL